MYGNEDTTVKYDLKFILFYSSELAFFNFLGLKMFVYLKADTKTDEGVLTQLIKGKT